MKITRNTLRADGITIGEAIDKDAAFLRSMGLDASKGGLPFDEALDLFKERARTQVLNALDDLAEQTTGQRNDGPKDGELAQLFAGIDQISCRIFLKLRGL